MSLFVFRSLCSFPFALLLLLHLILIRIHTFNIFSSISFGYQGGYLPIHLACDNGHGELVRFLLESDPSTVSVIDEVSCIVLVVFRYSSHFLQGHTSSIHLSLSFQSPHLPYSISPHSTFFCSSQEGCLPIHFASSGGSIEAVRLLLECDPPSVSSQCYVRVHLSSSSSFFVNSSHHTTPHLTPYHLCLDSFFFFLKFGNLPIHRAAENGHLEVVRFLLELHPASVSVQNEVRVILYCGCFLFPFLVFTLSLHTNLLPFSSLRMVTFPYTLPQGVVMLKWQNCC